MGKLFGNTTEARPFTEREILQNRCKSARGNLLAAIVFTVINIALLFLDGTSYFLFSIFIPYFIAGTGVAITGRMPEEFYAEGWEGTVFLGDQVLIIALVIAVVILGLYLLSWICSKKNIVGWFIFTLVIFGLDTLLMIFIQGIGESVVDLVFHVWVIVSLVRGISAYVKLQKMPEEEPVVARYMPEGYNDADENEEAFGEEVVEEVQNSKHLRMADMDAKARILLQTEKDGLAITYRRVKTVNELVINGAVYDEYVARIELAHKLVAVVDGREIEAGFDGNRSYLKIDNEVVEKKIRLY
jgi:hypothetical protein